jgi:hypothetical protein
MKIVPPDHAARYGQTWVSAGAPCETTRLAMIGEDLRSLYAPVTDETPPGLLADLARRVESQIARAWIAG